MLSVLIWLPLVGAILAAIVPQKSQLSRKVALATASLIFGWTIWVVCNYDVAAAGLQFSEHLPWIEWLGLNYDIGVDGLSLPLIVLNSFLTFVALWITSKDITRSRFYYSLFLVLQASVNGAFLAQDVLLFFLFYEIEIIPLYFMIAIWGGKRRGYAAIKFLLYTAISGILLLAAFLGPHLPKWSQYLRLLSSPEQHVANGHTVDFCSVASSLALVLKFLSSLFTPGSLMLTLKRQLPFL